MTTQRKIDGDKVAHGEVKSVTYNRPYRTYWNRYGESAEMPADPIQLMILMEQGWLLHKPTHIEKKPKFQVMKNGSRFEFSESAQEPTEAEVAKFNKTPTAPVSQAPTATYYTAEGTPLPNLPADPASMADYLKSGLSLNPPQSAKASGKVVQLLKEA